MTNENSHNKRNYQKELDSIIESHSKDTVRPRLLLHSCCAPCSSYCLKYLSQYFEITDFFYNPNISSNEEYTKRAKELISLISTFNKENSDIGYISHIDYQEGEYRPSDFFEVAKGLENEPERSKRCYLCYELRMRAAAEYAKAHDFDYFTTTLSISPLKNADWINEIGEKLALEYGVRHLTSDFKKRGGYQESIKLSKEYNLYRQNYCGCVFSQRDRKIDE